MPKSRKRLLIEGWRSISHSYAVVNQWQILALKTKKDLDLFFKDVDYYNSKWAAQHGLFNELDEAFIAGLSECSTSDCDAVLRVSFPYNFSQLKEKNLAVFATSEYKCIPVHYLKASADFKSCINDSSVKIFTPSKWSAEGFLRFGFPSHQVVVVPHGVDLATFYFSEKIRRKVRAQLGSNVFVFMCVVGAMSTNKGVDLLLRAFAAVLAVRPEARLLIKGADGLYFSSIKFKENLDELSIRDREAVLKNSVYHGGFLSMTEMAEMYQVADAYVSPYRAEGFNIPVLEAAACGVPVICTGGGSTDDFVTENFALKIDSKVEYVVDKEGEKERLVPDLDHLINLMIRTIDDESWRKSVADSANTHIKKNFTWDIVADKIIQNLF